MLHHDPNNLPNHTTHLNEITSFAESIKGEQLSNKDYSIASILSSA